MEAPEESVRQRSTLMRHKVEGVMHQVAIEHRDSRGPRTLHQMGECPEVSLLTLVQSQGPGGF
jgi:hypothetical protein